MSFHEQLHDPHGLAASLALMPRLQRLTFDGCFYSEKDLLAAVQSFSSLESFDVLVIFITNSASAQGEQSQWPRRSRGSEGCGPYL